MFQIKTWLTSLLIVVGLIGLLSSYWLLKSPHEIKSISPSWQSRLPEEDSAVFVVDSVLYILRDNYLYKIDKATGEVFSSKGRSNTIKGWQQQANITSSTYLIHSFEHTYEDLSYRITERFKATDSCTEYLHRYHLEVVDPSGEKEVYFLGGSDYYYVSEFAWIGKELYIIKTHSSGGDRLYLEKYDLS